MLEKELNKKTQSLFVEVLRRIAETVVFPCEVTKKYCGDLQRRRIRAQTARKDTKSWLVKFPIRIETTNIDNLNNLKCFRTCTKLH